MALQLFQNNRLVRNTSTTFIQKIIRQLSLFVPDKVGLKVICITVIENFGLVNLKRISNLMWRFKKYWSIHILCIKMFVKCQVHLASSLLKSLLNKRYISVSFETDK
jgi:hypothetical protein